MASRFQNIDQPSAAAVAAAQGLSVKTPVGGSSSQQQVQGYPPQQYATQGQGHHHNGDVMDDGVNSQVASRLPRQVPTFPPPFYESQLRQPTWRVKPHFISWEIDHRRFELIKLLGKGSYGSVAEAIDHLTGNRVAIKRITQVFDVFENAKRIYREVRILRSMNHPNIVRIVHLQAPRDLMRFSDLYVVFECMDTDFAKLTKDDSQCLTVPHVRWFLYQLLLGMKYVHSCRILHRDIKPANVLLTEACDLKVCDFGLARSFDDEDAETDRDVIGVANPKVSEIQAAANAANSGDQVVRQMTRHVVTRWYRAPELPLYNDGDYSPAIDIWSIGCVFAEMLGMLDTSDQRYERKALFPGGSCNPMSRDRGASKDGKEKKDQLQVILDVLGTPTPDEIARLRTDDARRRLSEMRRRPAENLQQRFPAAPPEAIDLVNRFLRFIPEDRISIDQALAHPFLEPIRQPAHEVNREEGAIKIRRATHNNIRQLMVEEIRAYNPHIPNDWEDICAMQAMEEWSRDNAAHGGVQPGHGPY